ncbi:protein-disulfide reductase DsbD domain-containing protein [Phaeodactylibacter luteus]|uniref:Thiol:disulfide interchange protein DsbD N-terminal domain-containing protein n=1 Tax=Phaeodactylibacter luteus TaxID=1564516 RepID=A0A5C6RHZ7_9BACT|nr:protein-disulfide reductase DsbD domain-containing protein [Phaeodactylibacter luteus]TXB61579.1 hypothetical protein FRY97_18470 [Phaeodactylibacter luteus]
MRPTLCALFLLLSIALPAQGQPSYVTWTFSAAQQEGQVYLLTFTADIEPGWYLYAQEIDEGGPIPTTIAFDEHSGLESFGSILEEGEAVSGFDEMFQMDIKKFKRKVVFTQEVTLKPGTRSLTGYVEYMTCNDEMCLPPREMAFAFSFEKG